MTTSGDYPSIPAMALASAERYGESVAVIEGDARLSYAAMGDAFIRAARGLAALGVQTGDRVALWAPNSTRWIVSALAVLANGAWLVPVNTRFKGAEAAQVMRAADVSAVLCVGGFLDTDPIGMLRAADPTLPALDRVVTIEGPAQPGAVTWAELEERGGSIPESEIRTRIAAIRPEDVSDIIFTSGTTGRPKGVILRHGASLRLYQLVNEGWQIGPGDRALVVMPFFHCFGYKFGWMLSMMEGATSVPMAVFEPAEALRAIESLGITHIGGSPTLHAALLDEQLRLGADLRTLRVATVSASYIPVALVQRMQDEMGLDHVMAGYGLTEAHATVSITYPDDPPEVVANWSGRPVPGVEVRLVDEEGRDVALGERGEVLVRGFNLSEGYYGDPEATASVFRSDGWLYTGDIAYMNEAGYIKICDRKKDMFIMGGFNVAPAEVEGILASWDKVAAAAVVGIPDDHFGEVGAAFVVAADGVELTPADVVDYARSAMANYKVPRRVELVDALPLNATGKVLKAELRARLVGS
jgi:acyl-CoA synthetase (AMP-forming)/AMP-acid ligase II